MKLKYAKLDLKIVLFILNMFFTPICYIVNPFLFVTSIFAGIFLLASRVAGGDNKFLIALLYAVLFSGVSIVGIRPYDVVIFIGMIVLLIKRRKIKISIRIIPFIIVVLFVLLIKFNTESMMEAIRYITCIMLFIEVINGDFNVTELSDEIIAIILANIYYAVSVFLFISKGQFVNYTSSIIGTNIYIYASELRLNGFFSDPNKYMAFCFGLLFIAEGYLVKSKKRRFITVLIIFSSLIALSRTALIVIFFFVSMKIALILKTKSKPLFLILLITVVILGGMAVVVPDIVNEFFNHLYVLSSRMMGRQRQLELSSTLQGDNRMRIWRIAFELIKEKPLVGHGWMSNEWLLPYPTHNTVLAILLDGGIIALLSYVIMFWPMYKCKRWDLVSSCIIVPSLMLDLQNYRMWFLIYGFIMCPRLIINQEIE